MTVSDWTSPPEEHVQRTVADWLDRHGVRWFPPPNEADTRRSTGANAGITRSLKPGVPDVMIVDPPPERAGVAVGTAIEH